MSLKSLAWSVAALLLIVTFASPLMLLTIFLVMTPFVVLFNLLQPKFMIVHLVLIGIIAYFLAGGYGQGVLSIAFFFLIPSLAMGYIYKRGGKARTAISTGSVVVLAQLLIVLLIFTVQFDIDLKAEFSSYLAESLKQIETGGVLQAGWAVDTAKTFSDLIMTALPMLLLLIAFLLAVITHGLSRLAFRTVGLEAPSLPKASTWRAPRSLVMYYLIAMIASFAMSEDASGYWSIAITNLVPILRFVFTVQAIGFFFFLAETKKWPRVVPLLFCIPLMLFPPAYIIGLLDIAFPMRKFFVK
ncbi:DUF2232 domain-containing protein [Cohnella abietis]|nr:DUF2232 domain-containing protein [Cohnella abietis]